MLNPESSENCCTEQSSFLWILNVLHLGIFGKLLQTEQLEIQKLDFAFLCSVPWVCILLTNNITVELQEENQETGN